MYSYLRVLYEYSAVFSLRSVQPEKLRDFLSIMCMHFEVNINRETQLYLQSKVLGSYFRKL